MPLKFGRRRAEISDMSATRPSLGGAGMPAVGCPALLAGPGQLATAGLPGQAFTDLLLLGALACQAPVALLSVPQADGTWSTLAHGLDGKRGSHDSRLFDFIASSAQPVEIVDLMTRLPQSPLVLPPHSLRWAYGTTVRGDAGAVLGVVVVLDRWLREVSRREQRALVALARQLGAQLVQWTRPAEADTAAPVRSIGSHTGAAGHRGVRAEATPSGTVVTIRHNLLRSHEVAKIFDVTERTVINWAATGKLPSLRTIGGHLRFRREDVLRLLAP
jgi:excisionase family DNA binding protein